MDLPCQARLGLRPTRRLRGLVALDEGPSLDLDPTGCLPLPLETPNRQLALPARHSKRTTGLLRVEGGFLLSGQALKLAVVSDPSAFLGEGQGLGIVRGLERTLLPFAWLGTRNIVQVHIRFLWSCR